MQASKQESKQASKQVGKQASKQAGKQASRRKAFMPWSGLLKNTLGISGTT